MPARHQPPPPGAIEDGRDQRQAVLEVDLQGVQPVAPPEAERQAGVPRPGEETPHRGRHGAEFRSHPQQPVVVRVSGKQLVAPITSERHCAVLAHQAAEQVGRDHG